MATAVAAAPITAMAVAADAMAAITLRQRPTTAAVGTAEGNNKDDGQKRSIITALYR